MWDGRLAMNRGSMHTAGGGGGYITEDGKFLYLVLYLNAFFSTPQSIDLY